MSKSLQFLFICFLIIPLSGNCQNGRTGELTDLKIRTANSKPDSIRGLLLVEIARKYLSPGNIERSGTDSAELYIQKAKQLNFRLQAKGLRGMILVVQSMKARKLKDTINGRSIAEKAVAVLKGGDPVLLGDASLELAEYYHPNEKDGPQKVRLLESAIAAYRRAKQNIKVAEALIELTNVYLDLHDDKKAEPPIVEAITIYQSAHYKRMQLAYLRYAEIFEPRRKWDNCLKYGLLALKTIVELRDTSKINYDVHDLLGEAYTSLRLREKAIEHYRAAETYARKHHDTFSAAKMVVAIAQIDVLTYEPEMAQAVMDELKGYKPPRGTYLESRIPMIYLIICMQLKTYKKGMPYAYTITKLIDNGQLKEDNLTSAYNSVIPFFLAAGELSSAKKYLPQYDIVTRQIGNIADRISNHVLHFRMDTATKNYRSAIFHIIKEINIRDTLARMKYDQARKGYEIQYETARKEDSLKLKDQSIQLLTKDVKLQKASAEKAHIFRNVTIGAAILLLIIIILLVIQYRNRQHVFTLTERSNATISKKNDQLQHLVLEKEWLLKEVHHRVKNNLHTIISLLESQAAYLQDDALKAVENSQHRIYAMSLIHQKLYQSDEVKTISMNQFLPELVNYLADSFGSQRLIRFHLDVDPIELGVSQAIPIAIILNECITNSIKYAFPDQRRGLIQISMKEHVGEIELVIADDGIGLPDSIRSGQSKSLGLRLMEGLSQEIHAAITFENSPGARITLRFVPHYIYGGVAESTEQGSLA